MNLSSSVKSVALSPAGRLRLDISRVGRAVPCAPRSSVRRKLKSFTFHNITIPYGDYSSGPVKYWMLFWHRIENGRKVRIRESRTSFAALKARAEEIALNIANGQTAMSQFREDDRAEFLACKKLAESINVPLQLLVSEAIEARKAARHKFTPQTFPQLVAQLLAIKRREKTCGEKWLCNLEKMLNRLAAHWSGPLHLARPADLNTWLRALPGGLVYRRHHRAAAIQIFLFAKASTALPPEFDLEKFFRLVDDPEPPAVKIKIWTPEQLVKLLAKTHPNMVPFTACQAFAGIRHEELVPEHPDKQPLDWRDFDWEQGFVAITEETGKTGSRIIPLSANLIAWLQPYAKTSGPVCELSNAANALDKAKKRAGLPSGKGDSRNVLRKSFGSYRLAVVKHIGQVADEMGNSPAKIKSNYRKPRPEREGLRWFEIAPTNADILQLPLVGMS